MSMASLPTSTIRKMTFEVVSLVLTLFVIFLVFWWFFAYILKWPTAGIAIILVPSLILCGVGAVRGFKLRWKLHYQQGKSLDLRFVVPRVLLLTLLGLGGAALMVFGAYLVFRGREMWG